MKRLVLTLFSLAAIQGVFGQNQGIRLELSSSSGTIRSGERTTIFVRVYDPGLIGSFKNAKYRICRSELTKEDAPYAFCYLFVIEPTDTGTISVGPVDLKYQDQTLHSNTLHIKVVADTGCSFALFDVQPIVKCLSSNEIRIRSGAIDISKIDLMTSRYYSVLESSYSTNFTIKNGITQTEYIRIFRVKFKAKGLLSIKKEHLKNVPDALKIDPVTIRIE